MVAPSYNWTQWATQIIRVSYQQKPAKTSCHYLACFKDSTWDTTLLSSPATCILLVLACRFWDPLCHICYTYIYVLSLIICRYTIYTLCFSPNKVRTCLRKLACIDIAFLCYFTFICLFFIIFFNSKFFKVRKTIQVFAAFLSNTTLSLQIEI